MFDLKKLVRPNIQNLVPYSSARDEFDASSGVFLDANENPFGTLNRYPDPYQRALKSRIAEVKNCDSTNIFIGNGSDEVIDLAFRILCQPGSDKALTFSPTYGMYDVSAGINEIDLIKVPLTSDFQMDREKIAPYFQDSSIKIIFICSPNNPSGNLLKRADIEWVASSFSGVVIIDEAYIDFSDSTSWLSELQNFQNLIVCQTLSKAWGLAAARVGMAFANRPIIELLNKVKPPYNISQPNQQAALNTLNNQGEFEDNVKTILSEKESLIEELNNISSVRKIFPSDANFFLIEFENANGTYEALVKKQVITRNRSRVVDNCLRITVGSKKENEALIGALKELT